MFRKIVVPLDGSVVAEVALGQATVIARAWGAEIDIVIAHGKSSPGGCARAQQTAALAAEQTYVESVAADLRGRASIGTRCVVLRGSPADVICAHARDTHADLIVMTSHGRTGLSRAWLGSVADAVVRYSAVPVLLLRPHSDAAMKSARGAATAPFKRVLVPLDGSLLSAEVLSSATDLAEAGGADLVLLRVVPPVPAASLHGRSLPVGSEEWERDEAATRQVAAEARRQLEDVAVRLRERRSVAVTAYAIVSDATAKTIVDFAGGHGIDVIAMSTHGRGLSRWLIGSVADKVLRASDLPVLMRRSVSVWSEPALFDASKVAEQLTALSNA